MVACDEKPPLLRGSAPDGSATAGDVLVWRRVDLAKFLDDCRKRHVDLIEFEAKRPGSLWLREPVVERVD